MVVNQRKCRFPGILQRGSKWRIQGAFPAQMLICWDWQLHAACRGMASSFFFHPEGERGPARARREAQAKAVCFECPAMVACRAHALQVHEPYGIWGGLSEGERTQMLTLTGAH